MIRLGQRCRVRCICGDVHCLAPASRGGAAGEIVDIQPGLVTVVLDSHKNIGGLDFLPSAVKEEKA